MKRALNTVRKEWVAANRALVASEEKLLTLTEETNDKWKLRGKITALKQDIEALTVEYYGEWLPKSMMKEESGDE